MAFSQRYGTPASIVYFDINGMKQVNDTYGHSAGDAVLLAVAKLLLDNVRTTDVVGRLGGDELGVVLVQTDEARAEHKAAELAAAHRHERGDLGGPHASRHGCLRRPHLHAGRQRGHDASTRPTGRCTRPRPR